jgi:cellulose synthase/poly-beta-1,6-N-acetylglucosamine synthase-like glycosyltransferase
VTAFDLLTSFAGPELLQFLFFVVLLDIPRYLLAAIVLAFVPLARTEGSLRLSVTGLVACHNETSTVMDCVRSMRNNGIDQIVVVLDGRNDATRETLVGSDVILVELPERIGKPLAMNVGLQHCTNELVLATDADTTFANGSVNECMQHFSDDVAGVGFNLNIRNVTTSLISRFQAVEYAIAFTAGRRIADVFGILPNVAGAAGLFRRQALEQVGGWDCEVAEDAALAMKLRAHGWQLSYAALAQASTSVPVTVTDLIMQRLRWDASIITIWWWKFGYFLNPFSPRFTVRNLFTSLDVLLFNALLPLILPVYLFWLWGKIDGHSLLVIFGATIVALMVIEFIILLLLDVPFQLLLYVPVYVVLQLLLMRPTRIIALIGELAFNITRRDDYIPRSERWRLT